MMGLENEKYVRTEIKEIIFYVFVGIVLFVILPLVGGFLLRGFEESFTSKDFDISSYLGSFIVYTFMLIGAIGLIIFPIARIVVLKRSQHPAEQKNPSWFTIFTVSLIHSPEENGALYKLFEFLGFKGKRNPMNWSLSMIRGVIVSILIFGALGVLTLLNPQLSISGVPHTAQQISVVSDVIFGAGVPSFAENGVLMFIFFLALGFNAYICSRFRIGLVGFFIIGLFFICPIMGLVWMQMHAIVYSAQETALFATFVFGWMGSTITLLFASFVYWLAWHFFNNFFIKIGQVADSNQDVVFISIVLWILLFVLWVGGEFAIKRVKRRKIEE